MATYDLNKIVTPSGDTYAINGSSNRYGTCETAASTVAKVATLTNNEATAFQLTTGTTVHIKFTNSNTATNPTLNVNGTGAVAIKKYGTTAVGTTVYTSWQAGSIVSLTYDGANWLLNDHKNENSAAGDITGVTAGSGLTGGGSSGSVTLNVGTGNGITVAANSISAKAGTGISVDANGIHNAGVRSVATGTANGTISVNTNGTTVDVAVKGLGTLAYENLDDNGRLPVTILPEIPSSLLPSYVDDVIEGYYYNSKFYKESAHTTVITGETGKIYVDLATNKTYRWGGSAYAEISSSLALGTTSSTAAPGNHVHTIASHKHSIGSATQTIKSTDSVGTLPSLTITPTATSKITSWSAGSAPQRSSFTYVKAVDKTNSTTTSVVTGVEPSGTVSVATGVGSNGTAEVAEAIGPDGTATVLTGVKASGTANVVKGITEGSGSLKVYSSDTTTTADTLPTSGRIPYVSSVSLDNLSGSGTVDALTGVKVSSSKSAAPGGHTHNVTVSGTTGVNSGTRVTVATGSLDAQGTGASVVTGSSGTATVLTGVKASGTASVWKGVTTTEDTFLKTINGGSGNLTTSTTNSTGAIKYISSGKHTTYTYSAGVLTLAYADDTAGYLTHTHTAASSGTTANAITSVTSSGSQTVVTAVAGNGTATAITGLSTSKMVLGTAAPNSHTHSYGSSTALTTTGNSGTNFNAATAVAADGTSSVLTGVNGGLNVTTKYMYHTHVPSKSSGSQSVVTGVAKDGTAEVLTGVKVTDTATVLTGVKVTDTATVLTGVQPSGTENVLTNVALSTGTAYSITNVGSVPSLGYEAVTVGSASDWSAGTLPTTSDVTVVTSVDKNTGEKTLTTNTPS